MRTCLAIALLLQTIASPATAQDEAAVAIIPLPASITVKPGAFTLSSSTQIAVDAPLSGLGRRLAAMLEMPTGFDLTVRTGAAPKTQHIALRLQPSLAASLTDEGYNLEVAERAITIRAATPAGVFYGIQTLRQLLPKEIFREARVENVDWHVPLATISDKPRFGWRGAHLDVSRHFQPKEFVKKYIDLLALHKMNRFHWHLTDDQGWRLEVRKYPRLTEVAAWRSETLIGRHRLIGQSFDGRRHGGFYTQEDVREIVAYAADRFITVVPEIEMPVHSQAVIAAYPELGVTTDKVEPRTIWSISPYILNAEPSTIAFMHDVLSEVLELFPSPWIHVGGDEAVKTQWQESPRIQARIAELGLKNEEELQSWFIRQMDTFLTARGRRLIGWDEILEGGLAENATVMSWRGTEGALAAARSGHDAVMSPTSHTYFDYYQVKDTAREPLNIGGFLPLETVYTWEPLPADLESQFHKHILGVQGQLWTEYLPTPKAVEYNAFPRLTALAEVAWTETALRRLDTFRPRLATHLERLRILDVNFRPLDPVKSVTSPPSR
jgi:hexosaminidase